MLKGKIHRDGTLYIERAGKFKAQECRKTGWHGGSYCNDYCPHFGEPVQMGYVSVSICEGTVLIFDELIDERGK